MNDHGVSNGLKSLLERARYDRVAAYDAAVWMEQEHRGASAAQYFYMRSALMGHTPAMLTLAGLYMKGEYLLQTGEQDSAPQTIRDVDLAVRWIRLAAKQGDHAAIYVLARCCLEGIGMEKTPASCVDYLSRIPFPKTGPNPYEVTEATVFGNLCSEMNRYIPKDPPCATAGDG